MVLLSPTSVDSQNALDEVSFAIDAGKRVIPIVLENCHIPLRLKRFQYIDFTTNYNTSLKNLLNVLKGIPAEVNYSHGTNLQEKPVLSQSVLSKYKKAIIQGAILLLAVIFIGLSLNFDPNTSNASTDNQSDTNATSEEPPAKPYKSNQLGIIYASANNWQYTFTFLGDGAWEEYNSDGITKLIQTSNDEKFIWLVKPGTKDTTIIDIDLDEISLYRSNRPDPTKSHIDSVTLLE